MANKLSKAKRKLREKLKERRAEQKREKYEDDQEAARFQRAKKKAVQEARREAREEFLEDAEEEEKEFVKRRERKRLKRRRAKTKSVRRRLAEVKQEVVDQFEDDSNSSSESSGQDNPGSGAVGVDLSPLESELEENTEQLAAVDDTLGDLESEIEGLSSAVTERGTGYSNSNEDQDPLAAMGFDPDNDPFSFDAGDDAYGGEDVQEAMGFGAGDDEEEWW